MTDTQYILHNGTSLAAPIVSGALALLKQGYPYLSMHELAQALLDNAYRDFEGYTPERFGMGILDIEATLKALESLYGAPTN